MREADLEGIYVNDFALYEQLQQQIVSRKVRFKVRWREENLLEQFQLYGEIKNIHRRKIWLKNGGYLVFDRTEALQVIDVNTGKFTGKKNFQSTIVQTVSYTHLDVYKRQTWAWTSWTLLLPRPKLPMRKLRHMSGISTI